METILVTCNNLTEASDLIAALQKTRHIMCSFFTGNSAAGGTHVIVRNIMALDPQTSLLEMRAFCNGFLARR